MNVAPRTPSCPTDLALEEHLAAPDGAPGSPVARHVAGCARCRAWLEAAAAAGARFQAEVAPRVLPRIARALEEAQATGPRGPAPSPRPGRPARRWWWMGGLAAIATAAAVAVFVAPAPRPPAILAKGAGLTVYVRHGQEVRIAGAGERVAAGDELRFALAPAQPCHAWIASLDAAGNVSRLAPGGGDLPARVEKAGALPGGAVLDATPGPERIFAVCTARPLAWGALERGLRDLARREPGAEGVRRGGRLPVPEEDQTSLLLERTSP